MGLAERSDDELMLLARGGQVDAFDELVRRHQPKVIRVARRYLGDAAGAADVAQATLREFSRAVPSDPAEGRLSSYLYRMLLNGCRMRRRAARSEARAFAALANEMPPPPGDPDDEILRRERAAEVER